MKFKSVFSIILLFGVLSCSDYRNPSDIYGYCLRDFFESVTHKMSADDLNKFKECEIDSAGSCIKIVHPYSKIAYSEFERNSEFGLCLDSIFIGNDEIKIEFLDIALHHYLNGKPYDIELIKKDHYKMANYILFKRFAEEDRKRYQRAKENFEHFALGDTICGCFPIEKNNGRIEIVYNKYIIKNTDNCTLMEDRVGIHGVLREKFWRDGLKPQDSPEVKFDITVLDMDTSSLFINNIEIKPGVRMQFDALAIVNLESCQ